MSNRRNRPPNRWGCKPDEDVCVEHDMPLGCRHGCREAKEHKCGENEEAITQAQAEYGRRHAKERKRRQNEEAMNDEDDDICGLCGMPGADKIPHPIYWPRERRPDTGQVHAECEAEECQRASDMCQGREREEYIDRIVRG